MPSQPVTQPSTPSMDNDVINLAKAIRQTESGGNFNAKGGSGESGAYQWMPDTWKAHAKQALGNENAEMTPSNQNAVAYTVLKSWKDQGLNPAQIAAKWNSGSEVGWENKRGVNSAGVQYDVPKYVKSVTDAYQTVKAGGQAFADPNNPSSVVAPQPEGDGIFKSMAKAIISPVATMLARPFQAGAALLGASGESIDKWTKNNLGDWVAPTPKNMGDVKQDVGRGMQTVALGMGPVSGGAAFGTGMSLEQGNDLLSTETAINAGLGLAGGKLLDLVGKPLLNGAGKTIGVITPAILKDVAARGSQAVEKFMAQHAILPKSVGGAINKGAQVAEDVANAPFKAAGNVVKKPFTSTPEEVIAGREKALFEIEQKYAGMRKNALYSKDGGASSRKRIADTDVLVGAVDENGLIRTRTPGGAYDQYKAQYVEPGESVVMDLLEKEARSIDLAVVERNLIKAVRESRLAGKDHLKALNDIKKEIEGYKLKADKDGRIRLSVLQGEKIGTTKQINWNTPPEKTAYRKAVAKGLKRTIEKESRYNIREANEELGKYYEDLDFLESLDGKIVNRGRLGKYFAQIAGNIAGGVAGGMSGGMAGSAIGTIVGGELASRIQGIMLSRALGGAAGKGASRSAILEKAVAESKAPRLALPAPKPGALRSEIKASKPINLAKETDSTRQLKERQNPNIKAPEGSKVSTSLKDQRSRKGTQNSQKIASPIKKPNTISDRVQEKAYEGKAVRTNDIKVYRTSDKPFDPKLVTDSGVSTTTDFDFDISNPSRVKQELLIDKNAKILKFQDIPKEFITTKGGGKLWPAMNDPYKSDVGNQAIVNYAKSKGFDGVDLSGFGEGEIRVINPNVIKVSRPLPKASEGLGKKKATESKPGTKRVWHVTTKEGQAGIERSKSLKSETGDVWVWENKEDAVNMVENLKKRGSPRIHMMELEIPSETKIVHNVISTKEIPVAISKKAAQTLPKASEGLGGGMRGSEKKATESLSSQKNTKMVKIYRGQNEKNFSLDAKRQKVNNMKGTSFTRERGLAEAYTKSGRGNNPTIIEAEIPEDKIMKFSDLPPIERKVVRDEVAKMSDDDIIEGSLVENVMDRMVPYASLLGKEAIDMSTFFRNLVDEIRVLDDAKTFKLNKQ